MMSQMAAPQSNAKRYWGDEKNLDSIYSIYIKKICYTYSNDTSIYASTNDDDISSSSASTSRRSSQDEKHRRTLLSVNSKHSISTNDVAKLAIQQQLDSCQKKQETTPRSRKNFFQKYRRRSCSVDKYSFEKAHKSVDPTMTGTSAAKSNKTGYRYGFASPSLSAKKKINDGQQQAGQSNDLADQLEEYVDGYATTRSNNNETVSNKSNPSNGKREVDRSNSTSSKSSSAKLDVSAHKCSMNDISMQTQAQSLLWETRKIKILQAATLDHVLKFILLINSSQNKEQQLNLAGNISPPPSPAAGASSANSSSTGDDGTLDEERNNVAHIIHVFFCTYRIYTNPHELMLKLMMYSDFCRIEQYRFVMFYWMENYPEDFNYIVVDTDSPTESATKASLSTAGVISPSSINSYNNSMASYDSSTTSKTNVTSATTSDSENNVVTNIDGSAATTTSNNGLLATNRANANRSESMGSRVSASTTDDADSQLNRRLSNLSLRTDNSMNKDHSEKSSVPLISELLRLNQDEHIKRRALRLHELHRGPLSTSGSLDSGGSDTVGRYRSSGSGRHHHHGSKNSAVLDLDSRYVAQQLTAIDLENFLNLRPYSMLDGSKSDKRIQSMIKNFNLLSRHVVVTILKSHNPNIVTAHWIAIAMNLRKIKNFNSLKAIIAGLTNESIFRLKQLIWSKIDRISLANFKLLASIVDDVNNQIVLRQTQLVVEGTAKMSIEDDSFGTIPYLGTFLTDLNMIDARYQSYVPSPKDETLKLKLINFEKCAKQFEILTQVQLLQKNVLASLQAIQRRNNFDEQTTLNRLKLEQFNQSHQMLSAKPMIPKVSRLFENWFFDENIAAMTDKQCYEISVTLEQNVIQR